MSKLWHSTEHGPRIMQELNVFGRTLFILALVTLLVVGAYDLLPPKKWHWIPSSEISAQVYSDQIFGGVSEAKWIDQEQLHFDCEIKPHPDNGLSFCGVRLDFLASLLPATDLSGYDEVYFDVDYSGENNALRFYMLAFVPGFTDPENPIGSGLAKYQNVYIPTEETDSVIVVNMQQFMVADWWVTSNRVPRQFSMASSKHIMALGVDIVYPVVIGRHELKINGITFSGAWISAENWYLSIVLIWVSALLIGGIIRFYFLRNYTSTLQEEKNKYLELSMIDQLTGLLNRHGLSNFFENEMATGECGWPVAMLLIDIDHFKPINDTYGHKSGDIILRRISETIRAHSRQGDKVARWGGEEFLVLLPKISLEIAFSLAERLRKAVAELPHPEISDQQVTISIGVAELNVQSNFDEAFNAADAALYRAKHSGRNRVVCDSPLPKVQAN